MPTIKMPVVTTATKVAISRSLSTFRRMIISGNESAIINGHMTGIHYLMLMLMLLWGCRQSEHAGLVWGELLSETGGPAIGRRSTSHVYMKEHPDWGPYVFFYNTKNGRSHRMPLTPMMLELLKRRQFAAAEEAARRGFGAKSRNLVFPARSPLSRWPSGRCCANG